MLRKATLLSAVAGAALFASSAWADVFVFGTVDKTVTIIVDEDVVKEKTFILDVDILQVPEKFAQSSAHFNQRSRDNEACENCAEKIDTIIGSVLNNVGITSVNQSSGNSNNQGTVISIAFDVGNVPPPDQPPNDPNGGFAESQVAGAQHHSGQTIHTILIAQREANLINAVNLNVGITAVNQSAGNINNQANAISMAVSRNAGVSLSDSALGQFVTTNSISESEVSKLALTTGSINLNRGITQVNQTAGVLANQSNVVSLAVTGF